jgi:hypothetical protein
MSSQSGATIVTNGMVLCVDAANPESYMGENYVSYSTYMPGMWQSLYPVANTVLTTGIDAPDGSNTAVRISCFNVGNSLLRVNFPSFTANGTDTYTVSFWVRRVSGGIAASNQLTTDLNDGGPSGDYLPLLVTSTWVRVSFSGVPTAGAKTFLDLLSDNTNNFVLDYWGVQIEKSAAVGAYTPTNGAIVTRPATMPSTSWRDVSGNGLHGTLANSPIYTGVPNNGPISFPYSFWFNANGKVVTFANSSLLRFEGNLPYTLSLWCNITANPGYQSYARLMDRDGDPGTGRSGYNVYLNQDSASNTSFMAITSERWCPAGGGGTIGYTVSTATFLNRWQNIVFTYDGATMTLYYNGVSVSSGSSAGLIVNGTSQYTIMLYGSNRGYVGQNIVYNRAITASEVTQNYQAMRGVYGV